MPLQRDEHELLQERPLDRHAAHGRDERAQVGDGAVEQRLLGATGVRKVLADGGHHDCLRDDEVGLVRGPERVANAELVRA